MTPLHEPPPKAAPVKVCGGCSARYDATAWSRLELCGTISGDEARTVVTSWPSGAVIELRRCATCRMTLARSRPQG